jgi:hypothetical protein
MAPSFGLQEGVLSAYSLKGSLEADYGSIVLNIALFRN